MTYTTHTVWIGGPPKPPIPARKILHLASADEVKKFNCIQEQQRRNRLIMKRRKQGATFPVIALQVGVSSERCRQIYNEQKGMK